MFDTDLPTGTWIYAAIMVAALVFGMACLIATAVIGKHKDADNNHLDTYG